MFASREQAGQKLGQHLKDQGVHADLVLGLPRGGVVVAAGVARELDLPLDVLVVRKIGHPLYREFAIGAMAENGVVLLDERVAGRNPILRIELERVIAEEEERLAAYKSMFHLGHKQELAGKAVLLVDDGLATGSTMEAAALSARKQQAARIIIAVPTASVSGVRRLEAVADQVEAITMDPYFDAVGNYYETFTQTTDEEVLKLLREQPARVH
jgi:putative phosphoribosyl transferase